jgi:3-hydroxyacyl-[acyl-carrier-protein] dehydratase
MRFHLVDRIDKLEHNRQVLARKLTSHREDYWRDYGRGSEMPQHLILEALCQAGTWLVISSTDRRLRAALLSIDSVTFFGPVRPGDLLALEGNVDSINEEIAVLSGTASVAGETVMQAESIMCALIDADRLDSPEATRAMQEQLLRIGDSE